MYHHQLNEKLDPKPKARLQAYGKLDRDMLAEDIRQQKPDVIVLEREIFDWDAWARSKPAVAEELKALSCRRNNRIFHYSAAGAELILRVHEIALLSSSPSAKACPAISEDF